MKACENNWYPRAAERDSLIVSLLYTSGMRVGELCKLELRDYDPDQATLRLRETKNGRDHVVFLHPMVLPYLDRWLAVRGEDPGALVTSLTLKGTAPLCNFAVLNLLRRRAADADVARMTPHDFRRTFATTLLREHDPSLVGKLMNHNKLTSTLIYDLAGDDEQRAAVGRLVLPVLDEGEATRTAQVDAAAAAEGAIA